MNIVFAVQIFTILLFVFSLRMKMWKTSVNTFIFICSFFILTVSREIEYFKNIWAEYHTSVVGLTLLIATTRVTYLSLIKHKGGQQ